jgi:hypothetical protein
MVRLACPLVLIALFGCSARPALRDDADVHARGRALALAAAAAHGGLDRWRTLGGVRLHLTASGPFYPHDADYLLDPARNRAIARWRDTRGHQHEWRYDARRGTELTDGRCTAGRRRRALVGGLLSNLLFWFGVPFKFLDEGAIQWGVDADRFLVTYRGVGDTPDDWYLVTLAPDRRVAHLIYMTTGFSRVFEFEADWPEYRVIDGLVVGTRRRIRPRNQFWRWLAPRIEYQASDVRLGEPLDDAAFAPPKECA